MRHLAWAKSRALENLDRGDLGGSVASMISELNKRQGFDGATYSLLSQIGLLGAMLGDASTVPRWIEGYN
jgi:hypothetical protein